MTKRPNKKNGGKPTKKTAKAAPKKIKIPTRRRREPFKTLTIVRKHAAVSKEQEHAWKLYKEKNKNTNFLKLEPPGEKMDEPAYKVSMPGAFSTTLFAPSQPGKPASVYYVYNVYNFMDELTKYDIFRKAAHVSSMNPKRSSAYDEATLVGMAMCATFDVKRRREKLRFRGKVRPGYNNYGKRMMDSPRMLIAKQQKFAQPHFGQIIAKHKDDIIGTMIHATKRLDDGLKSPEKDVRMQLRKFLGRNREWVKDRMMCEATPLFMKFPRSCLQSKVVNTHSKMAYRTRGDQDLFNEFNFISSHLAFSAHFCRVMKTFRLNRAKEDSIIQKTSKVSPLVRVRMSRYSRFPAISVVNYNKDNELQTTLPRIPRKAPSIGPYSGWSDDSKSSVATDTPLDFDFDWKTINKEPEHKLNMIGNVNRAAAQAAGDKYMAERKLKETIRRKHLLMQADRQFELQDKVPIFKELPRMHPSLFVCKTKSMELNKLRRAIADRNPNLSKDQQDAERYLLNKRIEFLERTLPCKDDPRIMISEGWKKFSQIFDPKNYKNIARLLKPRTSWVMKSPMSRRATIPRCDRQPMPKEEKPSKSFLVLILLLTLSVSLATMAMISFL